MNLLPTRYLNEMSERAGEGEEGSNPNQLGLGVNKYTRSKGLLGGRVREKSEWEGEKVGERRGWPG